MMNCNSRILQWNTEGNKQALEVLLEEAEFDFLLIQEPWINPTTRSTYCPRSSKYYLIHALEGRAAIFVKKGYPVGQWDFEATQHWCKVWLPAYGPQGLGLELWSVYNPPDNSTPVLQALLDRPPTARSIVLAGDFNLHHPQWDYYDRYDLRAESLLQLALQWDLSSSKARQAACSLPNGRRL